MKKPFLEKYFVNSVVNNMANDHNRKVVSSIPALFSNHYAIEKKHFAAISPASLQGWSCTLELTILLAQCISSASNATKWKKLL